MTGQLYLNVPFSLGKAKYSPGLIESVSLNNLIIMQVPVNLLCKATD